MGPITKTRPADLSAQGYTPATAGEQSYQADLLLFADSVNDHLAHSLASILIAVRGIKAALNADPDPSVAALLDAIEMDAHLSFTLTKLVDEDMRKHQNRVAS